MDIKKLRNIGVGMEKLLSEINIKTKEEFLEKDPHELYDKLKRKHPSLHLAVLASFIGAHSDTPWYMIYGELKEEYTNEKLA